MNGGKQVAGHSISICFDLSFGGLNCYSMYCDELTDLMYLIPLMTTFAASIIYRQTFFAVDPRRSYPSRG